MNSNTNTIWDNLIAQVVAAGINTVDSWPNDPVMWLASYKQTVDRLPAAHVALVGSQAAEDATCDGDILETLSFTITIIFSQAGSNKSTLITLRDSILTQVLAVSNLNSSYVRDIIFKGWAIEAQDTDTVRFALNIDIVNIWQRS